MILYFGNVLSQHGYTPTTLELLIPHLEKRYTLISASSFKNPIFRMLHMIWIFFKYKKQTKRILLDTYSTWAFYYAIIIAVLSKLYAKPYIPILHGGDLKRRIQNNPKLSNYLFSNAYINVSPSLYLQSLWQDNGYNVLYIPNLINISQYPYLERKSINPKILWVRSLHYIYNPSMAVRVLYELEKSYKEVELCMVGPFKDNSVDEVKKLADKLSVTKNLKITGKLSKTKWIELSKEYDIFLNTTNFDNQPLTLLESMALGLPIVSTDVGGIPGLIDDNETGLLVHKDDINKMIEKITSIIEGHIDGSKISRQGRRKAETFDAQFIIKKWYNILD